MARTADKLAGYWGETVPFEESLLMEPRSLRLRRLLAGYSIEMIPRAETTSARQVRKIAPARLDP